MTLKNIAKKEDFGLAMSESDGKLVLIDFHANWCGPCRMIKPFVEKMAEEHSEGMIVYKCDVDECPDVSSDANVSCMPTFHLYKNRQKVGELLGASQDKLKELIVKHISLNRIH